MKRIRALQIETASKLNEESKAITLQRIAKKQALFDEEMSPKDPAQLQKRLLVYVLKAFATALDPHSAYFTPDEATQFMIEVQQSLYGIGAQLRDDLNGITITKILEGGPAAASKELKVKDKIIAVNGEPIVGMDIQDVVNLIRGPVNTQVTLTVLREVPDANGKHEEKLDITLTRGEVILKSTRYEANFIPFGDGGIAYLKLFSFYQDAETSSAKDLENALKNLKKDYNVTGVVLDLRFNPGGLLTQASEVAGLFIGKGVVVSIKDNKGEILHLRHLESTSEWDGPLIVLENRATASAAEIVTGTLQDYGRAIVVGDDHTYGKGSYQTFTLNPTKNTTVNPLGEYKVTEGFYYTVSGSTPQLTGVHANITVPGPLSYMHLGEKFAKYPLEPDRISPEFDDDLKDIPADKREKISLLYKFNLQPKLTTYDKYLPQLIQNSELRIKSNKRYQKYLADLKKNELEAEKEMGDEETGETQGQVDFQMYEAYNIMRDLLYLMLLEKVQKKG